MSFIKHQELVDLRGRYSKLFNLYQEVEKENRELKVKLKDLNNAFNLKNAELILERHNNKH